jgi:hypothetical protein
MAVPSTLVAMAMLLLAGGEAQAGRTRELGLADMASRAGRIFHGKCIERVVVEPPDGARPYTTYTFEVGRAFKGGDERVVKFSVSGTPDRRGLAGLPVFEIGERSLLLLYPTGPKGLTSPMGLDQGYFRLLEATDGSRLAVNGRANQRLLRDVPQGLLHDRGLDANRDAPLRLEALEDLLRALAQGGRP